MTSCAALLAAYFGGMQIADVDRSKIYDVPATLMAQMTLVERTTAKAACAFRYGVRYRVMPAPKSGFEEMTPR